MCRDGESCERNWKRGESRDESSAASATTRPAISASWRRGAFSYFCQPSFFRALGSAVVFCFLPFDPSGQPLFEPWGQPLFFVEPWGQPLFFVFTPASGR